jgi:hypothetical protein
MSSTGARDSRSGTKTTWFLERIATRKRKTDMPRVRHGDTPEYAVDVIAGVKPIGSQLAVAAGLLAMVLVAMSTVEAPMQSQDLLGDALTQAQRLPTDTPGLLCSIRGKIVSWISVEAS